MGLELREHGRFSFGRGLWRLSNFKSFSARCAKLMLVLYKAPKQRPLFVTLMCGPFWRTLSLGGLRDNSCTSLITQKFRTGCIRPKPKPIVETGINLKRGPWQKGSPGALALGTAAVIFQAVNLPRLPSEISCRCIGLMVDSIWFRVLGRSFHLYPIPKILDHAIAPESISTT